MRKIKKTLLASVSFFGFIAIASSFGLVSTKNLNISYQTQNFASSETKNINNVPIGDTLNTNNTIENVKVNNDRELTKNKSSQPQSSYANGEFIVDDSSNAPISGNNGNFYVSDGNAKGYAAGKNGILVPRINGGLVYIDAITGKQKWQVGDDGILSGKVGDLSNGNDRQVSSITYDVNSETFIAISRHTVKTNYVISVIKESDGSIHSKLVESTINMSNTQLNTFTVVPIINSNDSSYIITPCFNTNKDTRRKLTTHIWINNDGTFGTERNFNIYGDYYDNSNHAILGIGAHILDNGKLTVVIDTYWPVSGNVVLLYIQNYKLLADKLIYRVSLASVLVDEIVSAEAINGGYIDEWTSGSNNNYEYAFINTIGNKTTDGRIIYGSFSNENASGHTPKTISLQNDVDWDIRNGRIISNTKTKKFCALLYTTYSNKERNRVIRLRMDRWDLSEGFDATSIANSANDNQNGPDERVSMWNPPMDVKNSKYPIYTPLMNDDVYGDLFFTYDNIYPNISSLNSNNTSDEAQFGWSTEAKNNATIETDNKLLMASQYSDEDIKNLINNNFGTFFNRYIEGSSLTNFENIEKNDDTRTITISNPTISKGFNENGVKVDNLKLTNIQFTITGFKAKNTVLLKQDWTAQETESLNGLAPYELTVDKIKQFIVNKQDDLFDYLPNTLTTQNITLSTSNINITNSTSCTISFTVQSVTDAGTENKEWSINISNLTNKDTKIKQDIVDNGINATGDLANFSVSDVVNAINGDNSNPTVIAVEKFLYENKEKIFDYLPTNNQSTNPDDWFSIERGRYDYGELVNQGDNWVEFKFSVKASYNNGRLVDDWYNPINQRAFTIKIKNLFNESTNLVSESINADASINQYAPYEIKKDHTIVQNYIIAKQDELFNLLPEKLTSSNTTIGNVTINNSTSISVEVTIPAFENGVSKNKLFRLTINQLANKTTSVVNSVAITGNLADKGINDVTEDDLKQYIIHNKQTIITNIPIGFTDSNIIVENKRVSEDNGTITVTVKLTTYVNENGELIENNSQTPYSKDVIFSGFRTTSTIIKPTIAQSGIQASDNLQGLISYKVSKDDVKQFVVTKQNEIFENPVTPLTSDNVVVDAVNANSATEIQVAITIPAYTNGSQANKQFSFKIVGFVAQNTELKSKSVSAIGTNLATLASYEITNSDVATFVSVNYLTIFNDTPKTSISSSEVTDITFTKQSSTSINVSVTVPAYVDSVEQTKQFNFIITDLKDSSGVTSTSLKINSVTYNDGYFSSIFKDFSEFFTDWTNDKYSLTQALNPVDSLKQYLNNNESEFFENLQSITDPVLSVSQKSTYSNNTNAVIFSVEFRGYNSNLVIDTITQDFSVFLKTTINFDSILSQSELNNIKISLPIDSPTDEVVTYLQNKIQEYLDRKKLDFGSVIPNIYDPIKVTIDKNLISINNKTGTVSLKQGAIKIQSTTGDSITNNNPYNVLNSNYSNSDLQKDSNVNWIPIVIFVSVALLFIILLIIAMLIIRHKWKRNMDVDDDTNENLE